MHCLHHQRPNGREVEDAQVEGSLVHRRGVHDGLAAEEVQPAIRGNDAALNANVRRAAAHRGKLLAAELFADFEVLDDHCSLLKVVSKKLNKFGIHFERIAVLGDLYSTGCARSAKGGEPASQLSEKIADIDRTRVLSARRAARWVVGAIEQIPGPAVGSIATDPRRRGRAGSSCLRPRVSAALLRDIDVLSR